MSFFESQAFAALIGGLVLIVVSGGQALLSYKNSKLLVEQSAEARRDESVHLETQWRRQNRADQVTAIEHAVEVHVRAIAHCYWQAPGPGKTTWPDVGSAEEAVEEVLANLRAFSAAQGLDPSGDLGEAVDALYNLSHDVDEAYDTKNLEELTRLYTTDLMPFANKVSESLAAARAR